MTASHLYADGRRSRFECPALSRGIPCAQGALEAIRAPLALSPNARAGPPCLRLILRVALVAQAFALVALAVYLVAL
eukprot:6263504-Pyramimonas_sp.AAC.1